jgi:hypothetical protein
MDEGGSRDGAPLFEKAHCRGSQRKAPLLATLSYERKALGMGISLHGDSVGQPGVGLSTGDFERWLKGALEVGRLSLWELCEGNLEEGSSIGDFESWMKGLWGMGHLSL